MNFVDFQKKQLATPVADGLHKECRAPDPDNCRKCHTGRFAPDAKEGKKVDKALSRKTEPWKVFKKGNKELFAYTVRGEGSGEEKSTKAMLAEEVGCNPEDIDVIEVTRTAYPGKVPGEKGSAEVDLGDGSFKDFLTAVRKNTTAGKWGEEGDDTRLVTLVHDVTKKTEGFTMADFDKCAETIEKIKVPPARIEEAAKVIAEALHKLNVDKA